MQTIPLPRPQVRSDGTGGVFDSDNSKQDQELGLSTLLVLRWQLLVAARWVPHRGPNERLIHREHLRSTSYLMENCIDPENSLKHRCRHRSSSCIRSAQIDLGTED